MNIPKKVYAKYEETELYYRFEIDKYPKEGAVEYIRKDVMLSLLEQEKEDTGIGLCEYDAGHENCRMELIASLTDKLNKLRNY